MPTPVGLVEQKQVDQPHKSTWGVRCQLFLFAATGSFACLCSVGAQKRKLFWAAVRSPMGSGQLKYPQTGDRPWFLPSCALRHRHIFRSPQLTSIPAGARETPLARIEIRWRYYDSAVAPREMYNRLALQTVQTDWPHEYFRPSALACSNFTEDGGWLRIFFAFVEGVERLVLCFLRRKIPVLGPLHSLAWRGMEDLAVWGLRSTLGLGSTSGVLLIFLW